MEKKQHIEQFIQRLKELHEQDNRGALSALRRALSGRPAEQLEVFRYIGWRLPPHPQAQDDYILIAAMFAYHPMSCDKGNMGAHFASLRAADEAKTKALERRFTVLLKAHPDELAYHLRTVISLLKSKDVPIYWTQLLYDVRYWGHHDRFVQREWATAFWSQPIEEQSS